MVWATASYSVMTCNKLMTTCGRKVTFVLCYSIFITHIFFCNAHLIKNMHILNKECFYYYFTHGYNVSLHIFAQNKSVNLWFTNA